MAEETDPSAYFPTVFPPHLRHFTGNNLEGAQDARGSLRRGLNQSKDPNQKKALEVYVSFFYLYAKIPLCFSYLIRVGYLFFSILTLKN